jgi:hypothetical protein
MMNGPIERPAQNTLPPLDRPVSVPPNSAIPAELNQLLGAFAQGA